MFQANLPLIFSSEKMIKVSTKCIFLPLDSCTEWGRASGHAKCHCSRKERGARGLWLSVGAEFSIAPETLLLCFKIAAWTPGRWRAQQMTQCAALQFSQALKAAPIAMLTLLCYLWLKDSPSLIYPLQMGLTPCARFESSHLTGLFDLPAGKK